MNEMFVELHEQWTNNDWIIESLMADWEQLNTEHDIWTTRSRWVFTIYHIYIDQSQNSICENNEVTVHELMITKMDLIGIIYIGNKMTIYFWLEIIFIYLEILLNGLFVKWNALKLNRSVILSVIDK